MRRMIFIGYGVLVMASGAVAQPVSPAEVSAGLSVSTDIDSAVVVLDDAIIGRTPLVGRAVPPGSYQLRIIHPDMMNWLSPVMVDSVRVRGGELTEVSYRFDRRYMVRSEPSGAEVSSAGAVLGATPLVFEAGEGDSVLTLRKPGFLQAQVRLDESHRGILTGTLRPEVEGYVEGFGIVTERPGPATLPLVLSGASAIIAGGFSAYFKTQADRNYSEYLATGDPRRRAETRKLDSFSTIALAASQMYLALFAYLLLSP